MQWFFTYVLPIILSITATAIWHFFKLPIKSGFKGIWLWIVNPLVKTDLAASTYFSHKPDLDMGELKRQASKRGRLSYGNDQAIRYYSVDLGIYFELNFHDLREDFGSESEGLDEFEILIKCDPPFSLSYRGLNEIDKYFEEFTFWFKKLKGISKIDLNIYVNMSYRGHSFNKAYSDVKQIHNLKKNLLSLS